MTKKEQALDTFMGGYHCSQSVLAAFADDLGLHPDLAKTISLGLAGGSGTYGYCGCISGAYMVLSMAYGHAGTGDPEKLSALIAKNQAFYSAFKERHGKTRCRDLIGLDVFTPEGFAEFTDKNLKADFCTGLVADTVEILESLMG